MAKRSKKSQPSSLIAIVRSTKGLAFTIVAVAFLGYAVNGFTMAEFGVPGDTSVAFDGGVMAVTQTDTRTLRL